MSNLLLISHAEFPWMILSENETEHFRSRAAERKVSLNSMLLSCLNRVAVENFGLSADAVNWLYCTPDARLLIELKNRSSAKDVYNQIRFKAQENQQNWILKIKEFFGIRENLRVLGIFRNISEWADQEALPPTLEINNVEYSATEARVDCAYIIWRGRLSVKLSLRSDRPSNNRASTELLEKFKFELHRCFY